MRVLSLVLLLCPVCACTTFPELEDTIAPEVADLPYPTLEPQEDLLITAQESEVDEEETRAELAARSADLNARSEALRNFEFEFP